MPFKRPDEVRRSFAIDSNIKKYRTPAGSLTHKKNKRVHRTNFWPGERINYEFLERCKECVLRVKHPTGYFQHKQAEYRISILPWSRGSYVDIRMYKNGGPSPTGILLHLDVLSAMLPDLIATIRNLEVNDVRDPEQKAQVEIIPLDAEYGSIERRN